MPQEPENTLGMKPLAFRIQNVEIMLYILGTHFRAGTLGGQYASTVAAELYDLMFGLWDYGFRPPILDWSTNPMSFFCAWSEYLARISAYVDLSPTPSGNLHAPIDLTVH